MRMASTPDQITFDFEDSGNKPKEFLSGRPVEQPVPKTKMTIANPPPRGVGLECELRSFG